MKRTTKKRLTLTKQTVAVVRGSQLDPVAGGCAISNRGNCDNTNGTDIGCSQANCVGR